MGESAEIVGTLLSVHIETCGIKNGRDVDVMPVSHSGHWR